MIIKATTYRKDRITGELNLVGVIGASLVILGTPSLEPPLVLLREVLLRETLLLSEPVAASTAESSANKSSRKPT